MFQKLTGEFDIYRIIESLILGVVYHLLRIVVFFIFLFEKRNKEEKFFLKSNDGD